MKKLRFLAAAALWLSAATPMQAGTECEAFDAGALRALFAGLPTKLPADVTSFICRRAVCNHWAGEDAYDPDRARQIETAVKRLRCGSLSHDETNLQLHYSVEPDVLRALERTRGTKF